MSTITKICLILLLTSGCIFTQEQRFILINSSDTVKLKPLTFTYQVSEKEKYNYTGIEDTLKEKSYSLREVDEILSGGNFTNKEIKNKYTITGSVNSGESIIINLSSSSELDRLYLLIQPLNGIEGKIISSTYESPEDYHSEMYKKMFNKAKKEASEIAGISGNSLGMLLEVSEIKSMWDGYGDVFDDYKLYASEWLNPRVDLSKQYIRRLQFKFEMK